MEKSFYISLNIMGDPSPYNALVNTLSTENGIVYNITMPNEQEIAFMLQNGEWVQTKGTPLDSNTFYSVRDALNKQF